ncbi:MAG: hypothetical protein J2O44_03825, partial [Porphyrobacter sp.]|nr:hypothetical protein [Porphyrobacter sp.]
NTLGGKSPPERLAEKIKIPPHPRPCKCASWAGGEAQGDWEEGHGLALPHPRGCRKDVSASAFVLLDFAAPTGECQ